MLGMQQSKGRVYFWISDSLKSSANAICGLCIGISKLSSADRDSFLLC